MTTFTPELLQRLRGIEESGTRLARNTVLNLIERAVEANQAEAKVAAVRELHTMQLGGTPTGDFADVCSCGLSYWPCPTITALDGEP